MSEVRTRWRFGPVDHSTYEVWNSSQKKWVEVGDKDLYVDYEWIQDVIGNYGANNALLHTKRDRISARMSGSNGFYRLNDWAIGVSNITELSPPGWNATEYAARILSATNPSRPHILLPVSVFELKDIVRGIQSTGRSIIRKLQNNFRGGRSFRHRGVIYTYASLNLAIRFGLLPLISDVQKLMSFDATLQKRVNEMNRLFDKGGLRRKLSMGTDVVTVVGDEETILSSPSPALTRARPTTVSTVDTWATVRWKPSASLSHASDSQRRERLQKLLYGLDGSQVALNFWNALPWSWLIDWASTTGSFLQGNNNSISMVRGFIPVMKHTETVKTWEVTSKPSWVTLTPSSPEIKKTRNERFIVSPGQTLTATVPLLNAGQLSILGSLSVLRSR